MGFVDSYRLFATGNQENQRVTGCLDPVVAHAFCLEFCAWCGDAMAASMSALR
jgi:hypothetical protein